MSQNSSSSILLSNILKSKSVVNQGIYAANLKNGRKKRIKNSTCNPVNFLSRREKVLLEMNRLSLGEPIRISGVLYDIDEQEEEDLRMNSRKKVKKPSELYTLIKSSLPSEKRVGRDRNEIQESLKQRQDIQRLRQENVIERKSTEVRDKKDEEEEASETGGKVSILKEKVANMKEEQEFWHIYLQILELIPNYGGVVQQMGTPPAELGERKEFLTNFLAQIIKEKESQEISFKERERDYIDHIKRIEDKLVRYEESLEHQQIDSNMPLALKDFHHIYYLGEGGNGRVKLMCYKKNKEIYAVKQVAKVKNIIFLFCQERVICLNFTQEDIGEEITIQKKLKDQPNIITLKGSWTEGDKCFLLLELAENGSLHSHLYSHDQTFSRKQIYKLYQEICKAVKYLHSRDIMHGDIKPGNILLGLSGQVKLADFGCASEHIEMQL